MHQFCISGLNPVKNSITCVNLHTNYPKVLFRLWTLSVDNIQPTLGPRKGWEHTKYSEVFSENVILNLNALISTILQTRGVECRRTLDGQNCTEGPVWTRATPWVLVSVSVRCQVVMSDFKFVVASNCEEWLIGFCCGEICGISDPFWSTTEAILSDRPIDSVDS